MNHRAAFGQYTVTGRSSTHHQTTKGRWTITCQSTDEHGDDASAIKKSLTDPATFAHVFERHFETIHRYAQQRLGPGLADEIAAETFTAAFDRREGYDPSHIDARPWLLGIATNLMSRHWRAEGRRLKAYAAAGRSLPAGPDADGSRIAPDVDPDIMAALRKLTREDRETLLLMAWAELSYEEIADALSIPVGTVRSRIFRARRRMRGLLDVQPLRPTIAKERHRG